MNDKKKMTKTQMYVGVSTVIISAMLGGLLVANNHLNTLQSKVRTNVTTISSMENQITKMEQSITDFETRVVLTDDEALDNLHSAKVAGEAVAYQQNLYASASRSDIVAIAETIDTYLSESSKTARVPWFAVTVEGIEYTWTFDSSYEFEGNDVDVVWLCKRTNGELVAYATATYDATTNKFTNVEYNSTRIGQSYSQSDEIVTTNNEGITYDGMQDLIDSLAGLEPSEDTDDDTDMSDVISGRDALREAGVDAIE